MRCPLRVGMHTLPLTTVYTGDVMKRFLSILLASLLLFSFTSCGEKRITMPFAFEECVGQNVYEIKEKFESLGFENVSVTPDISLNDYTEGYDYLDVTGIKIGSSILVCVGFKSGSTFKPDSEIVLTFDNRKDPKDRPHECNWIGNCTENLHCSICGATNVFKKGEHTWQEATCTEPVMCSVCGKERSWLDSPLGHDWQPATCETAKTCKRCGIMEGEPQHDYPPDYSWEYTVEPTCKSSGERQAACKNCGKIITKVIDAVDHDGEWRTEIDPESGEEFEVERCRFCGVELGRFQFESQRVTEAVGDHSNNFTKYNNEEQQETTDKYVLNKSTKVFHYPWCNDVAKIKPANYKTSNSTRDEIATMGYKSCGHCNP